MRIHLIPNSHIDPVWLWDKYEGLDEVLGTFRSACDRLDEYPNLTFAASSLQFYEWVRKYDAKLFQRIVKRVQEGRWEVAGGWWVESDTNLPTEASFIKSAEISQEFSRKHFGREIQVAYLPDTLATPPRCQRFSPVLGSNTWSSVGPMRKKRQTCPRIYSTGNMTNTASLPIGSSTITCKTTSPKSSFLPCGTMPNIRSIQRTASSLASATTAAGQASPKSPTATASSKAARPATSAFRRASVSSTRLHRRRTFRSIAAN